MSKGTKDFLLYLSFFMGTGGLVWSVGGTGMQIKASANEINVKRVFPNGAIPAADFSVSASPNSIAAGAPLTVNWTAPAGRPSNDWIALYRTGAANTAYLWWQYTQGATSGSFTLNAPTQTGTYEFRYLLDDGYTDSARSNTVTVTTGGGCAYAISPTSQTFSSNAGTGSVAVTTTAGCAWTAASNAPWITITAGASGTGNGNVSFSVAANPASASRVGTMTIAGQTFTVTQSGASTSTYTLTATPGTVSAGGTINIAWTAPTGRPPTDWIGLYRIGDPNTTYLWWVYTNGATSGNSSVAAPAQAGQYEFRYLPNDGFTDVARSNPVTVSASSGFTLTASPASVAAGNAMNISWTASGGRSSLDWIALYRAGEPNSNYLWWGYTYGAPSGTLTLTAPSPAGQYEFRYLLSEGYSDAARSNAVTIMSGPCTYSITPTGQAFPSAGGPGSVKVFAPAGCSWTAASSASWITINSGASGSGNGTVTYTIAPNAGAARNGTATIAGKTFTFTQAATGSDPRAFSGAWDPTVIPWPNVPLHMSVLPNGKVLTWSDDVNGEGPLPGQNSFDSHVWDPASGTFSHIPVNFIDAFCAGHVFLPDGRLMAAGGHIDNGIGTNTVIFFDYRNNSWTQSPLGMNAGRWYPTVCLLANGDSLIATGNIDNTQNVNPLSEIFTAGETFRELFSAQLSMYLYSWLHLAPNGKVFNSGPGVNSRYLDTSGTGTWTSVAPFSYPLFRDYGTSVMYEPGKVVIMGGGDPPTKTAEIIDLNTSIPAWQAINSMAYERRLHNSNLLPDGKVLVTGGTSSPGFNNAGSAVRAAEMWDPQTASWVTLASMQVNRLYHSAAVLLPDGRVLSAGGGRPSASGDVNHLDGELFSPPYLFKGPRPTISNAPTTVAYGQTFSVTTPDAAGIAKVNWIRLPSTTHCNNMNQRFNALTFSSTAGGLNVTAPANANLCPPGHYMMFILNGEGVPSVAKIIQIL